MSQPTCWKCSSSNVAVVFTGYAPVYHKASECPADCQGRLPGKSCGEVPQGKLTCRACGNVWKDGDISEYQLSA